MKKLPLTSRQSSGELPIKTAGCLYLGLLASMYLERTNNKPKLPPEVRSRAFFLKHRRHTTAERPSKR